MAWEVTDSGKGHSDNFVGMMMHRNPLGQSDANKNNELLFHKMDYVVHDCLQKYVRNIGGVYQNASRDWTQSKRTALRIPERDGSIRSTHAQTHHH